jgi:hypothetical protein
VGEPLDFFKYYYAPAWSVLYWMTTIRDRKGLFSEDEIDATLGCQAMAMLLHSLDDHLADGDVPVTHLTLLVRSQAWLRMNECIDRFCTGIPGGIDIARGFMSDYFSGITEKEVPLSLDLYCDLFRKQMATWVIMPVLAARKSGGDESFVWGIRSSFESFGIAWRLLDDIQDLEADMAKGARSSIYVYLGEEGRTLWDSRGQSTEHGSDKIYGMIRDARVLETIAARIVSELDHAAGLSAGSGLAGLAEEYRNLVGPVKEWMG